MEQITSTIVIVLTIIGTGVALALVIMPSIQDLRRNSLRHGERLARIEGILQPLGINGKLRQNPYEPGQLQTREEK